MKRLLARLDWPGFLAWMVLTAVLALLPSCQRPSGPTQAPALASTSTATPRLVPSSTFTTTPTVMPTSTATSVPPSRTPTDTPTPAPAAALPALAAGEWPAVPQVILEEADHSMRAARFDRGEPWPVTGPLADPMSAVQWAASPDGRWLAVVQSVGWRGERAAGTLFLVDLEGGQARLLAPSLLPPGGHGRDLPDDADRAVLWENAPAWNPDGTRLAFLSAHQGGADLYVYELASGEVRRVAAGTANAAWPRWSPDGKTIVYTAVAAFGTGAGPNTEGLWIVPADGSSAPRQLTAGGKQTQALDAWLDAARILVVSYSVLGQRDLEAIDVESGTRTPLVEGELADYAWSEAAGLAAASPGQDNEALAPGLYLIDPVGAGAPVRVADQQAFRPRWSPSGRYLTFTTGDGCALYDRQEGTSRQVEEAWCGGTWSPHERYLAYSDTSLERIDVETGEVQSLSPHPAVDLRWSPDGGWLLCLRQKDEDRFDLFALRTADGALRPVAYEVSRDALRRATWVPPERVAAPPVTIVQVVGQGSALETQPARDEDTQVLVFRDRLLFRADGQGEVTHVGRSCTLERQYPESNLYMTDLFYASTSASTDRRWVVVENDDRAPCLIDTGSGVARALPAGVRVSWEPGGTRFAYVERPGGASASREGVLYIYDTEGHAAEPLYRADGLYEAIWSPDGARIAVSAIGADGPSTYAVLDAGSGEVRYSGPYDTWPGDTMRWSVDGTRLAVSRIDGETGEIEWDVLELDSGQVTREPLDAISAANGWMPGDVERQRVEPSHSGRYVARAEPPQRTREGEWWTQPSTVSIVDAGTGETVRAWHVSGIVPAVRWSWGDGWLLLSVLQVEDVVCEQFGPCGVHGSVWRLPVNGAGEPEMVIDDGFLVEAISRAAASASSAAPTSPTIDEILSQGTAVPFEVCGESTTWERPPESEQDARWWRSGRYDGADDPVVRYPWTHAFLVTYGHGSTTNDVENLSGLWTLPEDVWARCREPERQDAILKLQTAEVWALYHRVKSIRRLGAHTVVVVEPVERGVQFVQFARPEQQVPLTFHFVTEDGQEIEEIVEAESTYWPYPGLVPTAQP